MHRVQPRFKIFKNRIINLFVSTIIGNFYSKIVSTTLTGYSSAEISTPRGTRHQVHAANASFHSIKIIMFVKLHLSYKTCNLNTNTRTYFFENLSLLKTRRNYQQI